LAKTALTLSRSAGKLERASHVLLGGWPRSEKKGRPSNELADKSQQHTLFPYGIPFPKTPLPPLCRIFVSAATGLRVLRVPTGSLIDLAPFGSDLREMDREEAFGSSLA